MAPPKNEYNLMGKAIVCSSVTGAPDTRFFATVQYLSCFASTRLICFVDDFCFCRQAFCEPSLSASLFNFLGSAPIFLSHGLDSFRRTRRFSLSPFCLLVGSVQAILPNPPGEVPIPLLLFGSDCLIFMLLACAVLFAGDQSCLEACGWSVGVVCDTDFVDISEDFFSIFLIPALFPIHHLLWLR